ncbi:MAG: amidase [Chloroflexi bacterium]|nr:amidase [Chloroflexota bacterium]
MMSLTQLTLADAARLIAAREISPLDLTRAHLDRIARLDAQLNCFITVTADAALARARAAETEIQNGNYRGALHGVPLALKDLYETRGVRTTAGSKFFADYIPPTDCAVVEKLNAAGAIILGKLNLHEIALGVTNDNPHFGAAKNPWNVDCITGGSSGGSGAALAAEFCLGALGSDTGGSIRIPASLCGVVGLKPTYGRVSTRGVIPLSWNLDHAGPMARTVRDAAIILQTIAGYDAVDPFSINAPVENFLAEIENGVTGWRVAFAARGHFADADAEILRAVRDAARVFENLGARVDEIEIDIALDAARANGTMVVTDAAAFHRERLQSHPENFGADVRARLETGAQTSAADYIFARRTQTIAKRWFEKFFETYDILLTPATPSAAFLRAGKDAVESARVLTRFTAPFNLTGLPALSVPCGFTEKDLPIGLQISARAWNESRVLRAGYAYEQATEWHTRRPRL